jgi:uncharacterized membrane protein (DUF2068 family)
MNTKDHVKIIAALRIATGVVILLGAALAFLAIVGGGMLSQDRDATLITGIVGAVIAGVLCVVALPSIVAGFGLLRFKSWARYLTLVLAFFDLFAFPVGTLVGGYSLWVLLQEETTKLFAGECC